MTIVVLLIPAAHKVGAGVAVRAADTVKVGEMPSVVVIFEEISGAAGEGWAVTLDVTDTVTGTLLKEAALSLLVKSGLGVEDWVKADVMGRLFVSGVVLAIAAGAVVTKLLIDVVLGVSVCSVASLVTIEGTLISVAGVFGGAVVAEGTSKVDFIVIGGEDIMGQVFIKDVVDGFVAPIVTVVPISVVDLMVAVVGVVDLVKVVMMLLGFRGEEGALEEGCVVKLGVASLGESEALNEDSGLEPDVYEGETSEATGVMAPLDLPHSASTSAIMSPPEMESKVKSEEMSARSVLRLVSPGTIVACIAACDSLQPGVIVLDGDVAELSWPVRLLIVGSELSVPGLSSDRG